MGSGMTTGVPKFETSTGVVFPNVGCSVPQPPCIGGVGTPTFGTPPFRCSAMVFRNTFGTVWEKPTKTAYPR
jgi:hypothetical protein